MKDTISRNIIMRPPEDITGTNRQTRPRVNISDTTKIIIDIGRPTDIKKEVNTIRGDFMEYIHKLAQLKTKLITFIENGIAYKSWKSTLN